ncbi:Rho-type gtpase-activating protein, partial [Ascosphaera aggregata]
MDDSAAQYDVSLDEGDIIYPCNECGEPLEEGKAYELGGKRWHIDCFRCNTCNTLLDNRENILLLGDGSLICVNCTYSCSICGCKIEDLAILTGDQAFCGPCFKCRNCKKTIENLRYARTSQGIFCMECHDTLMARRRKRTVRGTAHGAAHHNTGGGGGSSGIRPAKPGGLGNKNLDKSLPSLPQSAVPPSRSPSIVDYYGATPEFNNRSNAAGSGRKNALSPQSPTMSGNDTGGFVPSTTLSRDRGGSFTSHTTDVSNEEFLIPVAFDPTILPPPHACAPDDRPNHQPSPSKHDIISPVDKFQSSRTGTSIDIPDAQSQSTSHRVALDDNLTSPHTITSSSSFPSSAHSNHNNNNGQLPAKSSTYPFNTGGNTHAQLSTKEERNRQFFKLQDVPKRKKVGEGISSNSSTRNKSNNNDNKNNNNNSLTAGFTAHPNHHLPSTSSPNLPLRSTSLCTKSTSQLKHQQHRQPHHSSSQSHLPSQQSSITSPASREASPFRKGTELLAPAPNTFVSNTNLSCPDAPSSLSSTTDTPSTTSEFGYSLSRCVADEPMAGRTISERPSQITLSPSVSTQDSTVVNDDSSAIKKVPLPDVDITPFPPATTRAARAASITQPSSSPKEQSFFNLAGLRRTTRGGSVGAADLQAAPSPSLLRYSTGGDFSMDEDISRILSGDDQAARGTAASASSKDNESVITAMAGNSSNSGNSAHNNSNNGNRGHLLKRMSDSMRHSRSMSDKSTRSSKPQGHGYNPTPPPSFGATAAAAAAMASTGSPRSPGSPVPTVGSLAQESSSPSAATPSSLPDDIMCLKAELQGEKSKNAEKDARIAELEKLASSGGYTNADAGSGEGRKTTDVNSRVADVLELYYRTAKERLENLRKEFETSNKRGTVDITDQANELLNEFSDEIEKLREIYRTEIDRLIQRRNDIMEEITEQEKQKSQCLQEFAQLSTKNAQLTDMNNEIVVQIRSLYKANSGNPGAAATAAAAQTVVSPPSSSHHHFGKHPAEHSIGSSIAMSSHYHEDGTIATAEQTPAGTVIQGPQVVNIRKGQPKKFMWKRGGQNVAKVTKGIRGAFASREGQPGGANAHNGAISEKGGSMVHVAGGYFVETPAYSNLPSTGSGENAVPPNLTEQRQQGGGFPFFKNQQIRPKPAPPGGNSQGGNAQSNYNHGGNGGANGGEQPGEFRPMRIIRFDLNKRANHDLNSELFGVELVQRIE